MPTPKITEEERNSTFAGAALMLMFVICCVAVFKSCEQPEQIRCQNGVATVIENSCICVEKKHHD